MARRIAPIRPMIATEGSACSDSPSEPAALQRRRCWRRPAWWMPAAIHRGSIGKGKDAVAGLVSGLVLGFQLIDPQARPLSLEALRQMAPNVAPQLLEWIAD